MNEKLKINQKRRNSFFKRCFLIKQRGFTAVEFTLVVMIMGVFALIAIPSYLSFKKRSMRERYRVDILSLHKSWQAFGAIRNDYLYNGNKKSSIVNVGMPGVIVSSKLYGKPISTAGGDYCKNSSYSTEEACLNGGSYWVPHQGVKKLKSPNLIGFFRRDYLRGLPFHRGIYGESVLDGQDYRNFVGYGSVIPGPNTFSGNFDIESCGVCQKTYTMVAIGHLSGQRAYWANITEEGILRDQEWTYGEVGMRLVCQTKPDCHP